MWSAFSSDAFASGVQKTGVMIEGILKDTDDLRIKMNPVYGKIPICVAAYIVIDGNPYVGTGVSVSLHDVLTQIDAQIDQFPQYAQTMQDFLTYWKDFGLTGEQWDFGFKLEQISAPDFCKNEAAAAWEIRSGGFGGCRIRGECPPGYTLLHVL